MTSAPLPAEPFRPGRIARAIAAFSGLPGLVIKIALLAVSNAVGVWAAFVLLDRRSWAAFVILVGSTLAIDACYLAPRAWVIPAKFLVPGTVFLIAFQLVPIVYTIEVAFSNYSTGHISTKADAIRAIKLNSLQPPANGRSFTMTVARDGGRKLTLLLHDEASGALYAGTRDGLKQLAKADVTLDNSGRPESVKGYTILKGSALFSLDRELQTFTVPTAGDAAIQPQGTSQAVELKPTLRYDAAKNEFVRVTDGVVFQDNGKGAFVEVGKPANELEPGWKTTIGFGNFDKLVTNPLYRNPFIRVFIWTFVYAALTVFLSFAGGLFLAIALDKRGMRFQRVYRSILVIPYAMPGFLSLLVWGGLLNDDFGVVNKVFHTHVPWLFDPNWARVSVILVSVWLTTPYFFLVSLGALQSIPAELTEAARVDGGGAWAVFRRVTLPLLLVAVAPLMIASFAFNFNNFNNIYLLTQGGPYTSESSIAGTTDILISYTYKLAIATGRGSDFGLASAVAIIIFFIVASISGVSFWRSKSLENMA